MSRIPALLTTGVLAAALGAGAFGVAAAASPSPGAPSADPSASAPSAKSAAKGPGLARRVLHGEFVVREKKKADAPGGFRTVAVQRGEITAVTATSITLKSPDGYSRSYLVNAQTTVRAAGKPAEVSGLKTGERAQVRASKTGSTYTATRIAELRAAKAPTPAAPSSG